MTDVTTAGLLLSVARAAVEHGKRLEPHLVGELQHLVNAGELPDRMRREAYQLIAVDQELPA